MRTVIKGILSVFVVCLAILIATTVVMTQSGTGGNHVVSLAMAQKFVTNYKNNPTAPNIKGGMFDRNIFDAILSQPDCVGIRYYYAKKDDGSATLVIVGVNSQGRDMENGTIGEEVKPCPPFCDTQGTLSK